MKDCLGRELKIGDVIVKTFCDSYATVYMGVVTRFTEKQLYFRMINLPQNLFYNDENRSKPDSVLIINEVVEAYKKTLLKNKGP